MTRSALCGHASRFKIEVAARAEMISHPQGSWNKTAGREAQCPRMTNVPVEQMNQTALIERLNFTRDLPWRVCCVGTELGCWRQISSGSRRSFPGIIRGLCPCSVWVPYITPHLTSMPTEYWCPLGGELHTGVKKKMHNRPVSDLIYWIGCTCCWRWSWTPCTTGWSPCPPRCRWPGLLGTQHWPSDPTAAGSPEDKGSVKQGVKNTWTQSGLIVARWAKWLFLLQTWEDTDVPLIDVNTSKVNSVRWCIADLT